MDAYETLVSNSKLPVVAGNDTWDHLTNQAGEPVNIFGDVIVAEVTEDNLEASIGDDKLEATIDDSPWVAEIADDDKLTAEIEDEDLTGEICP